ncbi:MAG: hypothetical protein IT577_11800 [Verrucomicrobiae bacterium]|nr:hypothetical protein [Verrucomicrobiae bacterium]
MKRRILGAISLALVVAILGPGPEAAAQAARELIADRHFRQGFVLLEPKPGKQVPYATIPGWEKEAGPVWRLAQWSSKFPLRAIAPERVGGGAMRYGNDAKSVTLGAPETEHADVAFRVNAMAEYGARARQKGEPWVHLLVEQAFERPPPLTELRSARLHVEARLLRCVRAAMGGYSPHLHAAQFQIFLTVQNLNRQSPGYGRYLWFGVPIYDDRRRIPQEHKTLDTGGTGMFIFSPRGDAYCSESAHDGGWVTIRRDILPLLLEALETAWSRGFLAESRDASDYRISGINLGWELPGTFDAEMRVRNLSLVVNTAR